VSLFRVDRTKLHDGGRTIIHDEDGKPLSDDDDLERDLAEQARLLARNSKYFTDEELKKGAHHCLYDVIRLLKYIH
jgi:hypothetical protein